LFENLMALVRILAPVMPHQAEDIWQNIPECQRGGLISILLSDWVKVRSEWDNPEIEEEFGKILKSREVVSRAIEPLRAEKKVGSSLEVAVYVKADEEQVLKANEADLADIYIVSQAHLTQNAPSDVLNEHSEEGFTVWVTKAQGEKCTRCWKYRELNQDGICSDCADAISE
jgi:isoleucyl-tRNA synthetase